MDHADSLTDERDHRLMAGLIHWLSARRPLTAALAVTYFVTFMLAHDLMQRPAYWAQGQLSHQTWNALVTSVSLPILATLCVVLFLRVRHHARRGVALFYLAVSVASAVISFRTLLVMNIEVVHFPHYAILAVLLFPMTSRHVDTILLATMAGLVDEGYQYYVLYADRGIHFDFNDVILNTLGAGYGLVFILVFVRSTAHDGGRARRVLALPTLRDFVPSPVSSAATVLLTASLLGSWLGWIRLLHDDAAPLWALVLRRGGPSTMYWTPTAWGKTYHEVQPIEWLVITFALTALYGAADYIRYRPGRE